MKEASLIPGNACSTTPSLLLCRTFSLILHETCCLELLAYKFSRTAKVVCQPALISTSATRHFNLVDFAVCQYGSHESSSCVFMFAGELSPLFRYCSRAHSASSSVPRLKNRPLKCPLTAVCRKRRVPGTSMHCESLRWSGGTGKVGVRGVAFTKKQVRSCRSPSARYTAWSLEAGRQMNLLVANLAYCKLLEQLISGRRLVLKNLAHPAPFHRWLHARVICCWAVPAVVL